MKAVETLLATGARKATVFQSEDHVVKATRRCKPNARARTTEVILTIGKPNYEERAFVTACRMAGEKFPVRKVQLKFYS